MLSFSYIVVADNSHVVFNMIHHEVKLFNFFLCICVVSKLGEEKHQEIQILTGFIFLTKLYNI